MARMGNRAEILDEDAYRWMPQTGKAGGFYVVRREAHAVRVDFVGTATIYKGWAGAGILSSEAKWAVQRLTLVADDDLTTEWADGDPNFDNVWDDRSGLSYV